VSGRPVIVRAQRAHAEGVVWHGVLDTEGAAAVTLSPDSVQKDGAVRADVLVNDRAIAEGTFTLTSEAWAKRARRRGDWVERRFENGVVLRAAAERGVFAVPFEGALWVEATHNGDFLR